MGHLYLIGMPKSGKTTLAKKIGGPSLDLDIELCRRHSAKSPRELLLRVGLLNFRLLESEMLYEVDKLSPRVIACGGGTPFAPGASSLLLQRQVVYLFVPFKELLARYKQGDLPHFLDPNALERSLKEIYLLRHKLYSQLSHHQRYFDKNLDLAFI